MRFTLVFAWLLFSAFCGAGEDGFRIDYTVEIKSVEAQIFHVRADVKNLHQDELTLSLPVWTPGWYTLENYARNVLRFDILDENGKSLEHERTHKQSWKIDARGLKSVSVEFDYLAKLLALNQAKIASDYAFFTGTQLCVYADGHLDAPSRLTLKLAEGWKTLAALPGDAGRGEFNAPDYDTLADAPVLLGKFDVHEFSVLGKAHRLAVLPAGKLPDTQAREMTGRFAKIVEADAALFGGLPYDSYTCFYFFMKPETRAGGGLEHANAHVCFFPQGAATSPEAFDWMFAHEYFHLWNAKRIRPAQLMPYDYSREQETSLLWVTEGFTSYYANLQLYRAGLSSRADFLDSVAGSIAQVESNPAHTFISPSEASTSTWLGYDNKTPFEVSYYLSGRNLAALLDLSILRDTAGKRGLDDVMRDLNETFALHGKGYDERGLLEALRRVSGKDYADFFKRHVTGIQTPPYERIFSDAGFKFTLAPRKDGLLGKVDQRGNLSARLTEILDAGAAQIVVREAWLRRR